jgi:pimeloyl-ACP methyl ester carboxylesterase
LHPRRRQGARVIEAQYHDLAGSLGYVEVSGEGAPLLCVHTAGQTGVQWRDVLRSLSRRGYRVIVPDLPGHGRSDAAPGGLVTDLGFYRDWCLELLGRLEVERALLVGCSIGGRIVLDIASHAPQVATGVVAMAANPRHDMMSVRGLKRELEDATSPSRGDRTYYGTLASLGSAVDGDRAIAVAMRHRREDPTISTADLIGWTTHDLDSRLEHLTAPVRLVSGEEDFWLEPAELVTMCERIPNCTTEVLEGVGHYPMEELSDFPELLGRWLEQMGGPANGHEE